MSLRPNRRLVELANRLGLCVRVSRSPEYGWDGKGTITLLRSDAVPRSAKEYRSNLAHEIAHWLCAAPSRRKIPDFGIGPGPDSMKDSNRTTGYKHSNNEECLASVLGIAIETKLFGWSDFTMITHGWVVSRVLNQWRMVTENHMNVLWLNSVAQLRRRGLLKDHIPTCLL